MSEYVTQDKCHEVSTMILAKLEDIEDYIMKNDDVLYGKIELGEPKGGLVNFVNDARKDLKEIRQDLTIIKKNSKNSLSGKDKAIIYSALLGSTSAILVALVK